MDLKALLEEANQKSFEASKPRTTAAYEFLSACVLEAAARGEFKTSVHVSNEYYYDLVNQKLIEDIMEDQNVDAYFEHGTWFLDWSNAPEKAHKRKLRVLKARADGPNFMAFAVMRNSHEAFRQAIAEMQTTLDSGNIDIFAMQWHALQEVMELHKELEDNGMFPFLAKLKGEADFAAEHLDKEHVEDDAYVARVNATIESGNERAIREIFAEWSEDFEGHMKHEEKVLMPMTKKAGDTPFARAASMHDNIISKISTERMGEMTAYILRILTKYGSTGQPAPVAVRVFAHGLQSASTPSEWRQLLPVVKQSTSPEIYEQLIKIGIEEEGYQTSEN